MKKTSIVCGKKNISGKCKSDNLYREYDFVRCVDSGDIVISSEDVAKFARKKFYIKDEVAEAIFEIAEESEIVKEDYNFVVHEDGRLAIGAEMATIKKNLQELTAEFKKFQNREFYNKIKFSL